MTPKESRNIGIGIAAACLLGAFVTNPDQATHLRAIKGTVALRNTAGDSAVNFEVRSSYIVYSNYFVFSATSFRDMPISYGYFGQVQTTDNITTLYRDSQ